MKVYYKGHSSSMKRAGPFFSLARVVVPLLAALCYLGLAYLMDRKISNDDRFLAAITFLLFFPEKIYFSARTQSFVLRLLRTWCFVLFGLAMFAWFAGLTHVFNTQVLILWALITPLAAIFVNVALPVLTKRMQAFLPEKTVVVVGASDVGKHLAGLIQAGSAGPHKFVGFFDDRNKERHGAPASQLLGKIDEVATYVKDHRTDLVYVALPMAAQPRIVALLEALRDTTATVKFVPDIFIADLIQAKVESIAGVPTISVCDTPITGLHGLRKRSLDLLICALGAPLVLPLMAAIFFLVRSTSKGPAFFRQRRYGLHGEEIIVWKFRSMRVMEDGDQTYKQVTRGDDRVTPVGKILRKTSLDELPQLINVALGSMSLVGPRPHAVAVNEEYRKQISGYMVRHKVRPGITGWAQVNGYRGGDDIHSMRKRIEFDLAYLRSYSLMLDIKIIFMTAFMLLKGDSKAY